MYKYCANLSNAYPSSFPNPDLRPIFIIIQIQMFEIFLNTKNPKSVVCSVRSRDHKPPFLGSPSLKSSINSP